MKLLTILFLLTFVVSTFAEEDAIPASYNDFQIKEAAKAKNAGIALITFGTLSILGGSAAIYAGVSNKSAGSSVMGGALACIGLALDIQSILMFKKSKSILKDSRDSEKLPISLLVSPNSLAFALRF